MVAEMHGRMALNIKCHKLSLDQLHRLTLEVRARKKGGG